MGAGMAVTRDADQENALSPGRIIAGRYLVEGVLGVGGMSIVVLGFSSPNALCRTFVKHGLPSPGQVRSRLSAPL